MAEKIDILKQDAKIGDLLCLYLVTGEIVKGKIIEINDNNIVVDVNGLLKRVFQLMIGGWEILHGEQSSKTQDDQRHCESHQIVEETTIGDDDSENNNDDKRNVAISLLDSLYSNETIDLSSTIFTNAKIEQVSKSKVIAITDTGRKVSCLIGNIAGYSKALCKDGSRIFCGLINKKNKCIYSVMEMTYEGLYNIFVKNINLKPLARVSIIYSIIKYLQYVFTSRSSKNLLFSLSNTIKYFDNPTYAKILRQIKECISANDYTKAIEVIDTNLNTVNDNELKVALLLKKAQLLTFHNVDKALVAYQELIAFCKRINYSSSQIGSFYKEVAKLNFRKKDKKGAQEAIDNALLLNPENNLANDLTNIHSLSDEEKKITSTPVDVESSLKNSDNAPIYISKIVEEDIEKHVFFDPEIKSLNGHVTLDIAYRLLEESHSVNDFRLYLETAKAFKSLPIGSYDGQKYKESVCQYLIHKSRSLFYSFNKILLDTKFDNQLSGNQLIRIKDCAISYYHETFNLAINGDNLLSIKMFDEYVKMELASFSLKKEMNKNIAIDIIQSDNSIEYCINNLSSQYKTYLIFIVINVSVVCNDLWNNFLKNTEEILLLNALLVHDSAFLTKLSIFEGTSQFINKINFTNEGFIQQIIEWKIKRLKQFNKKVNKISNIPFDILSLNSLIKNVNSLKKQKYLGCLNETDRESIIEIVKFLSAISLYDKRDEEQRKIILSNGLEQLGNIIQWNSSTTTLFGRFFFHPLLVSWEESIKKIVEKRNEKQDCFFTLEFDPPFYYENGKEKHIHVTLFNQSSKISEGFRLALYCERLQKEAIIRKEIKDILPGSSVELDFIIPTDKWGDRDLYEIFFSLGSRYMGEWSNNFTGGCTITKQRLVSINKLELKWKDQGTPKLEMFKGREEIVNRLVSHYCSEERRNTYVLYGLSRTGKSCILRYLRDAIEGKYIKSADGFDRRILPIFLDLGSIHGSSTSKKEFWDLFFRRISNTKTKDFKGLKYFIEKYKINCDNAIGIPNNFDQYVRDLDKVGIHPLFMFDEFSYMKNIIDDKYVSSSFLHIMRELSAEEDLASFIFAGTYDIKALIYDSKYNISGSFENVLEPQKPVFEISKTAAEELMCAMGDIIKFTDAAIREIHILTGDVPFWIQKICMNCGYYAIENNKPDIGSSELENVIKIMIGEIICINNTSIGVLSDTTFKETQIMDTDPPEIDLVLTTVAHLMKNKEFSKGVTYEHMRDYWSDNGIDGSSISVKESIALLKDRRTFTHFEKDDHIYYKYSLELFRRWWLRKHPDIQVELSDFIKLNRKKK